MTLQKEAAVMGCYQAQLVPLEQNLVAAVFPLMKIYPAEFCLRQAREAGWIESQSVIVSDYACDPMLRRRLEDLGTRVEIVSIPAATGGLQCARLTRLEEIRAQEKDHWWVNQYDNPCN